MIQHFYENIHGWFDYGPLYTKMVETFPSGSKFIEIGSWKGRSSAYMAVEIANSNKSIDFYCVDTWEGSSEHMPGGFAYEPHLDLLYETFITNMKPVENYYKPIKMKSIDASKLFDDNFFDFVFIDACHEYDCVKEDIEFWLPKVKSGGIMAGHDYHMSGVKMAIDEKFKNFDKLFFSTWMVRI
jgi:predicted O-methyltransferase YrrM